MTDTGDESKLKALKTVRRISVAKGFAVFLMLVLWIGDSTSLTVHMSLLVAEAVGAFFLHRYIVHKVPSLHLESKKAENFLKHSACLVGWCLLRLLLLPKPGTGSYLVLLITLMILTALFHTVGALLSDDVLTPLANIETLIIVASFAYAAIIIIIGSYGLDALPLTTELHVGCALVVVGYTVYRATLKRMLYPLVIVSFAMPVAAAVGFVLVFVCLLCTNTSWAYLQHNTKYELVKALGTSDDFALHPRELCNENDVLQIPKSEYPLIFKSSICTTSNKGVLQRVRAARWLCLYGPEDGAVEEGVRHLLHAVSIHEQRILQSAWRAWKAAKSFEHDEHGLQEGLLR